MILTIGGGEEKWKLLEMRGEGYSLLRFTKVCEASKGMVFLPFWSEIWA